MKKINSHIHPAVTADNVLPAAEKNERARMQVTGESKPCIVETDPVSLAQRLKELNRTDRSKLNIPDKISFLKERYLIQYQLDKQKELIHVPFIITVIAIIVLTLLL